MMHLCSGFHNKVLYQVMLCNLYGPFPRASRHHGILAGLDRRCLRLEFEGGSLMAVGELKLRGVFGKHRGLKICGVLCGGS